MPTMPQVEREDKASGQAVVGQFEIFFFVLSVAP